MSFTICYWDEGAGEQRERQSTPEEDAQRDLDIAEAALPVIPESIPTLNARLTLIKAGKMAAVRAYLAAMPGVEGELAREYFEFSPTMRRDHPLVTSVPAEILTEAEKDALFIAADKLKT